MVAQTRSRPVGKSTTSPHPPRAAKSSARKSKDKSDVTPKSAPSLVTPPPGSAARPEVDHQSPAQVVPSHVKRPSPMFPVEHPDRDMMLGIMRSLLSRLRSADSTICPSEVARRMHDLDEMQWPDWRALMDPIRDVVWSEVEFGRVEVTQGGVVRSLAERQGIKGPIRVRRGRHFKSEQ